MTVFEKREKESCTGCTYRIETDKPCKYNKRYSFDAGKTCLGGIFVRVEHG